MSKVTAGRFTGVLLLIAVIALAWTLPIVDWLARLAAWAASNPVSGALSYFAFATVAIVALAPGWIPMMLAGLVFGLWPGIAYAMLAITVGATLAMLVGRTLAREPVSRRMRGDDRLSALDDVLGERALSIVVLTRIAVVIPFNLLNYAYGVTSVRLPTYVAATAIGMLPVVAAYVYLGSLAQDLDQMLVAGADGAGKAGWVLPLSIVAIVAVVIIIRRAVSRALEARMRESAE